jgi:heme exporter protein B
MLSTEDIFLEDFNDGSLEQFAISNISLPYIIAVKIFIYWLLIGVPISIIGSLFCLGLTNSANLAINILPILLITSYIFINVFSFGNALSLNKGSALGTLVTLPLLLPLMIVLGKTVISINLNLNYLGFVALLLGILSTIILLIPLIISYIIRAHLE